MIQQVSELTQTVTSWGGLILVGTIGTVLAITSLARNDKIQKRVQRSESNRLLSQAWDILGNRPGTTWIFEYKNNTYRLEEAKRLIKEALRNDPKYPKAHMYKGVYWQFMGNYRKAVDYHRNAIKLNNTYSSAYNNLGRTYRQLGNWEAELKNYRLALKYDEHFTYARHNLGEALLRKGEVKEAIAKLERVTQQQHCPARVHLT